MPVIDNDYEIYKVLKEARRVAVIGISSDPLKAGYYVPKTLKEKGFELYGINPKYEGQEILGIKVYKSIDEIKEEVDVIVVFRPSKDLPEIAHKALSKGFKTFWMQPGTVNVGVKDELSRKGFNVVAGRCMKVESERLLKD
ncbi:MAG: CoA-binding protein [Thermodesulfobacteriota bacterium]